MGWFRKKPDNPFGYEDRAALKGIGGYEPADPKDATPDFFAQQSTTYPATPHQPVSPYQPASPHESPTPHQSATAAPSQAPFQHAPAPPPAQGPQPQVPADQERVLRTKRKIQWGCAGLWLPLVLVGAIVSAVTDDDDDDDSGDSGAQAPPTSVRVEPPEPEVVVPAAVEGWQAVAGEDGAYAYDVPPSWTPKPGVIHGWEADDVGPLLSLSTSAFSGEDHCESDSASWHAGSGVTTVESASAEQAARETASEVADKAYTPDGGSPRPAVEALPVEEIELVHPRDEWQGTLALARVTPRADDDPCLPDSALVGVVAITSATTDQEEFPVLVVHADQEYPGATSEDGVRQILGSLRAVAEKDRETVTPTPTS